MSPCLCACIGIFEKQAYFSTYNFEHFATDSQKTFRVLSSRIMFLLISRNAIFKVTELTQVYKFFDRRCKLLNFASLHPLAVLSGIFFTN